MSIEKVHLQAYFWYIILIHKVYLYTILDLYASIVNTFFVRVCCCISFAY